MPKKAELPLAVIEAAREAAQKAKTCDELRMAQTVLFPILSMFQTKQQDSSLAAFVQRPFVYGKGSANPALDKASAEIGVVVATAT